MDTRLEVRLKSPNPLFKKLLVEWLRDAETHNSRSQDKLREALRALESFPLPLSSGRECAILRGFSSTLCFRLDDALRSLQSETIISSTNYQADVHKVVRKAKAVKSKKASKKQKQLEALPITMQSESFQIVLLVDTQETSGKNRQDKTCQYLQSVGVQFEIRKLSLGDFLWVARDSSSGTELVLPYIVERKRMDDLASSIRDGRFHEQKHRLHKMPNVVYLVEDHGENTQVSLPLATLRQAMTNTQIHSGFTIVHTENHWQSMMYLQDMTSTLNRLFQGGVLRSAALWQDGLLEFQHFYQTSARNAQLSVREVFVQQLVQLHALSVKKALAIVAVYPTPRLLLDAYDSCASSSDQQVAARQLLANLRYGELQRPIGEKISEIVYDFYRTIFI